MIIAAVVAFMVFPYLGNALRWPARIVVAGGLVGLLLMAVQSVLIIRRQQNLPWLLPAGSLGFLAICLLLRLAIDRDSLRNEFYDVFPFPSSTPAVAHLLELDDVLEQQGIELVVVAMPYKQHLAGNSSFHDRLETRAARNGLARLSRSGIACVDLGNVFEETAHADGFWDDDDFHITEAAQKTVTGEVAATLGSDARFQDNEGSLIMGECFARQFGAILRHDHDGWDKLKILFANGDRGGVANRLFIFADEYIEGTRRVYWLMSYQLLSSNTFAKLDPTPDHSGGEREVRLEVLDAMGWKNSSHAAQLKDLPYENGLVEMLCETKDGERMVLKGYGIRERSVEPLGKLRKGHRIIATVVPIQTHFKEFPKTASEYVAHPTDDFESSRYWIKDWVFDY